MSENQTKSQRVRLLPHSFKMIGIALILLPLVPVFIAKTMNIEIVSTQKEVIKLSGMNVFILGLLLIAIARDKTENDLTMVLRVKSMSYAFIFAVVSVLLKPLMGLLFQNAFENESAQELVVSMLLVYLMLYYLQKKRR